jgi:hypothetical protein
MDTTVPPSIVGKPRQKITRVPDLYEVGETL